MIQIWKKIKMVRTSFNRRPNNCSSDHWSTKIGHLIFSKPLKRWQWTVRSKEAIRSIQGMSSKAFRPLKGILFSVATKISHTLCGTHTTLKEYLLQNNWNQFKTMIRTKNSLPVAARRKRKPKQGHRNLNCDSIWGNPLVRSLSLSLLQVTGVHSSLRCCPKCAVHFL